MSFLNFFSSDYFGHYGWSGILGAQVVFFAFIGFDAVSTAAQKRKIHKRNANCILGSLVICTVLYVLLLTF
jgi:APA family basic amino acid/polyamine antiporter